MLLPSLGATLNRNSIFRIRLSSERNDFRQTCEHCRNESSKVNFMSNFNVPNLVFSVNVQSN